MGESSTDIKGGGRAKWSEETQNAILDLLSSLRTPSDAPISNHELQRNRNRLAKQLVRQYQRQRLVDKVAASSVGEPTTVSQGGPSSSSSSHASKPVPSSVKVRVELVEAKQEYSKKNKKNDKKKSSKSKSSSGFVEGSKKVVVLARSTTVDQLLKLAASKLTFSKSKPPIRCFVVDSKKSDIQVDLVGDLTGLKDGDRIYVSSVAEDVSSADSNAEMDDGDDGDEEDLPEEDPLEAIKKAYRHRSRHTLQKRENRASESTLQEYPCIADHVDRLPVLSVERAQLPAAKCRIPLLQALETSQVVLVRGATGSGKSTNLPQYINEGMQACGRSSCQILVTQPRRVAAMSLAHRVSEECGSPPPGAPNSLVGYQVRLDKSVSSTARIVYCTTGILLNQLVCPWEDESSEDGASPPLSHLTHLVLDEVHERDLNTDFCLTLLRNVLRRNKRLRVVVMSATVATDLFISYFERFLGHKPPVLEISGRTFPVEMKWLDDCQNMTGSTLLWSTDRSGKKDSRPNQPSQDECPLSPRALQKIDYNFLATLVAKITSRNGGEGSILIFLPGKAEIESAAKALQQSKNGSALSYNIVPLHSSCPKHEQQRAFAVPPKGSVKIVLATNIAETSITIPDVKHVIDTGRVKESRFSPSTRIKELVTVWTSQASAKQRAGRAGRTSSGICWRLYPRSFHDTEMPSQTSPEIVRTPLDELALQICLLHENRRQVNSDQSTSNGVCIERFLMHAPQPPDPDHLKEACDHLLEVGALTLEITESMVLHKLTPLGYHLSRLPMDSKVGKVLVVGCMLECLDPALTIAAALSTTKSMFPSRFRSMTAEEWKGCVEARNRLIQDGFGGVGWSGGTVKGDMIACVAAFKAWSSMKSRSDKTKFCQKHGIDNVAMNDIEALRSQFRKSLIDAGFLDSSGKDCNDSGNDTLFTSCCLVAGMYPNVATLVRPRKGKLGLKGGRLLTKEGEVCRPSSSSFQADRVRNASESGRDAYAVFHTKHRSLGASTSTAEVFLGEVNFVSRFSLLLFGGNLVIKDTALIVDGWLKFKVGDKGSMLGAVLVLELRKELDKILTKHFARDEKATLRMECQRLLEVVRLLLKEE